MGYSCSALQAGSRGFESRRLHRERPGCSTRVISPPRRIPTARAGREKTDHGVQSRSGLAYAGGRVLASPLREHARQPTERIERDRCDEPLQGSNQDLLVDELAHEPEDDANEDWILEGVAPLGSDESLLAGLEEYVELWRELDG